MCASISDRERIVKNISIVLVSSQVPDNIGLCARVPKNTYFSNLRLVNPNLSAKSFEVSKRARDVLKKAKVFNSLKEAVGYSHFVFGTTRRKREYNLVHNFSDILPVIVAFGRKARISIVFRRKTSASQKRK